ncbi:hypothetical protein EMIHUDRAFT_111126 [Emiliania huxleyi CCMP1516]|uniref:Uncharacterized protein n=2 Tax=Emiliania huxleyi TaxID=2903 RepID=A0A0D3KG74_EMIH1|nr:hypothetical protein EMIHUDRAFT_111126 [Emiliania huxleyi CCMP1516]EOD34759.1 hypothetical protein EMIHUDRAFT_111126 [Emiliania huxleyi CCMP1516]|eukprot:XP_005787188.1 hypothetical protein EMIHUDRAFT_111126 [Emiliania huxleyi CCMP1516]
MAVSNIEWKDVATVVEPAVAKCLNPGQTTSALVAPTATAIWRKRGATEQNAVGAGYGGDYRYAREDKGVDVQLLLFESFGGFGKGVREILRKAADVLQNKLTRAQYLDEGDYRFAREKNCDLRLLDFETFGGFGDGVRKILRQAADQLSNKLSHAQHLDEVTWTTKNWHGLQMQRLSVVLHTAVAWQTVNELACGDSGIVHGAKCIAVLNGVA